VFRNSLGLRSRAHVLGVSKRAVLVCWLAWLVALLAAGAAAGASVVAGDPGWGGTEPGNISNSPTNKAWQPAIATGSSGRMFVAWSDQDSDDAPRNIYACHSDDNGRTWSASEVISGTAYQSALPAVCVIGSQAFVTWIEQSTVGGEKIAIYEAEVGAKATRRIPSSAPLSDTRPRLAIGSGRLHVVFNAGANALHATRPLTATSWSTATRVYTSTALFGLWFPMLDISPDGETLHMVWQEVDAEWTGELIKEWTIMYGRGEISGGEISWAPAHSLSTGSTELVYPAIAADSGGNLHVVWIEVIGEGDLKDKVQYMRYMRYDVASGQWISPAIRIDDVPVRVNQDNPTYSTPSLALFERDDRVEVCVAWHGFREGELAEDVLLSCSPDGGESWSAPRNVSCSGVFDAVSVYPSIAFNTSGQLHSVWQEHKADMGGSVIDNYQIFYSGALKRMFLPLVARNWG
jgi:hypothetical protein